VANACEAGLPRAWHARPPKSVAVANAPINGVDAYYEVLGDGPPLVIINGSWSTIDDVRPLIGLLVPAFRLAIADSQGVSRTSVPEAANAMADLASDAVGLAIASAGALSAWSA
jgi:hypothetical protein